MRASCGCCIFVPDGDLEPCSIHRGLSGELYASAREHIDAALGGAQLALEALNSRCLFHLQAAIEEGKNHDAKSRSEQAVHQG